MKGHTEIRNLAARESQEAVVRGWLYARRESGKVRFLVVS
jgi:aspartyl/asparaginyl-tRNA synthetase